MKKEQLINEFNKLNNNSNLGDIQKYITAMMESNNFNNMKIRYALK